MGKADAEVKVVEAEPLMPLDETRVVRLGLAEQSRPFAVMEAVFAESNSCHLE